MCEEGSLGWSDFSVGGRCLKLKWQRAHLGQLRLGEAGLAHLGGLAHGDVALGQRAL